MQFKFNTSYW